MRRTTGLVLILLPLALLVHDAASGCLSVFREVYRRADLDELLLALVSDDRDLSRAKLLALLRRGARADCRDPEFGSTPLHAAVEGVSQRVAPVRIAVRLLIAHGADVGARDGDGGAALHAGAYNEMAVPVMRLLVEGGADVNAQNNEGATPLHMSAISPCKGAARFFISAGAAVDARCDLGRTPLRYAVDYGNLSLAEFLISAGADVNALDAFGVTPLDAATKPELQKLLRDHGAVSGLASSRRGKTAVPKECLNRIGYYGMTPLGRTAWFGQKRIAALLLERGACVHSRDWDDETPLHLAARRGHEDVAQLLVSAGADVNARGDLLRTPLHRAAEEGHKEIAQLLVNAGADVNARDEWARTPLHRAADESHSGIADLLVASGAHVDARDHHGRTPLHEVRCLQIAELLVANGADVSARDDAGRTPLHEASCVQIAELLVANGADISAKTNGGRGVTPLYHAASGSSVPLIEFLIDSGADVNGGPRRRLERTPLDVALWYLRDELLVIRHCGGSAEDEARARRVSVVLRQHGAKTGRQLDREGAE